MKKVTISISGVEAVCNFGVNWYIKFFKESTGIDIFVDGLKGIETTKVFEILPALYFAGYQCECKVEKKEPKLKLSEFEDYVLGLDTDGTRKLLENYTGTFEKQGE